MKMTKDTHVLGSLNLLLLLSIIGIIHVDRSIAGGIILAGVLLGALLPDIDEPRSFIGRRLWVLSRIIRLFDIFLRQGGKSFLGHRGAFHSLLPIVLFGGLYFGIDQASITYSDEIQLFIQGIIIGYLSHLLLDLLTNRGIPLLYPFSSKKISISLFSTSSTGEWVFKLGMFILLMKGIQLF